MIKCWQAFHIAVKEWKLLLRNPHGLAVLFLMPSIFLFVLSFSVKDTLTAPVELPVTGWFVKTDSNATRHWASEWQKQHGGKSFSSSDALLQALKHRTIDAGVLVNDTGTGSDGYPQAENLDIWLRNDIQPAAAARLNFELIYSTIEARAEIAIAKAGPLVGAILDDHLEPRLTTSSSPSLHYVFEIESGRKITPVQKNVPAWLIFGMFFVVVPVAGVLIQERNDGTLTRLATYGVTPGPLLSGKLLGFMVLNGVQLVFMIVVGRWVVPWFGGDVLALDIHLGWFLLIIVGTSAMAISLALAVAAFTRTFDHAAALGSGLNVVLGAVAGVMVPRMLMPPTLQTISEWSPRGWALDAMQSVFLGTPDPYYLLVRIALLILLSSTLLGLSWWRIRSTTFIGRH